MESGRPKKLSVRSPRADRRGLSSLIYFCKYCIFVLQDRFTIQYCTPQYIYIHISFLIFFIIILPFFIAQMDARAHKPSGVKWLSKPIDHRHQQRAEYDVREISSKS